MDQIFPFKPGETIKRDDIHRAIGGSFRHGMTSCLNKSGFAIFHNPEAGSRFGYNLWEGFDINGAFNFTGQGKLGDQKLTKNNLKLLNTFDEAIPIYLFMASGDGKPYTYFGEYCLANPAYDIREAPDSEGALRKVFVFHLTPLGVTETGRSPVATQLELSISPWSPPPTSHLKKNVGVAAVSQVVRREHQLQKSFGEFLIKQNIQPSNLSLVIPGSSVSVRPDLYISSPAYVIEAKASSSRDFMRQAIGQVLDYANLLFIKGIRAQASILVPTVPSEDLLKLLKQLDIELIFSNNDGFDFSLAPTLNTELSN